MNIPNFFYIFVKNNYMAVLPLAMMGLGALAKGAGAVQSVREQRALQKRLDALQKQPMEMYKATPELMKQYELAMGDVANPQGFSGAETANFRQALARNMRGRFGAARSMGGGARGINAVLAGQEAEALGNFASQGEGIRRSNRLQGLSRSMGVANQLQGIQDRNTGFKQNYRLMLERALGEGIRSQRDYRRNMFSGMGSDLLTSGLMNFGGFDFSNGGNTADLRRRVRFTPPTEDYGTDLTGLV